MLPQAKTWRLALVAGCALTASLGGLLALAEWAGPGHRGLMTSLGEMPESEALKELAELERMGDAETERLVPILSDSRQSVGDSALEVLSNRLDRWQLLTDRDAFPRMATLARQLAEQAESWGPAGRQRAARLATRLLVWPVDAEPSKAEQFIRDCRSVLRLAGSDTLLDGQRPADPTAETPLPSELTQPVRLPRRPVVPGTSSEESRES